MRRYLRPVGIIVVAAIVGYLLARADHSTRHSHDTLSRRGATSPFSVSYFGSWHDGTVTAPTGLPLSDELSVGPSRGQGLVLGRSQSPIVGALPSGFLATVRGQLRPATVQLGSNHFDRYLDLRVRREPGVVSVYLLDTNHATIAASCAAPGPGSAVTGECEQVLATLRLRNGLVAAGGIDTAYALGLNAILDQLNPVRRSVGPGLQSANVTVRVRAARRLADAETRAATAANRLSPGSAASANVMLIRALRKAAGGYQQLASAATKGDVPAYETAQSTLEGAQQLLATAFQRLSALGYRLR